MDTVTIQALIFKVLDISVIWWIVYQVLKLIKTNVRAIQIVKGALWIYLINLASQWFNLTLLASFTSEVITWGILAVIIIFQPEIRAGLEQLGRNSALKKKSTLSGDWIQDVLTAMNLLSQEEIGALIVIEKRVLLDEYARTGTELDANISTALLRTIFNPNTPLHDGAVLIRDGRLFCAGAILPSTQSDELDSELGTRHRAALGVSELSDSITLVVSEETGKCSLAHRGQLYRFQSASELDHLLRECLTLKQSTSELGEGERR